MWDLNPRPQLSYAAPKYLKKHLLKENFTAQFPPLPSFSFCMLSSPVPSRSVLRKKASQGSKISLMTLNSLSNEG
jgi:hypothetical protein